MAIELKWNMNKKVNFPKTFTKAYSPPGKHPPQGMGSSKVIYSPFLLLSLPTPLHFPLVVKHHASQIKRRIKSGQNSN